MTVAALPTRATYVDAGDTATLYALPFQFLSGGQVRVSRWVDGVETVLSGFTVTGNGRLGAPSGAVQLADAVAGSTIEVRRVTDRTQPATYINREDFPSDLHQDTSDREMMVIQEQDDLLLRAQLMPRGEAGGVLPAAAARASRFRAWDASGNEIASNGTGADAGLRGDLADPAIGPAIVAVDDGQAGATYADLAGFTIFIRSQMAVAVDAYPSLQAAFDVAPEDAEIALSPGKLYDGLDRGAIQRPGQKLIGNGAMLKRAAQVTHTTTTAMTSGVHNKVTLNSVAGLTVGTQVALAQVGVARGSLVLASTLSAVRTIIAINSVSKEITLDQSVNANMSIGATLFVTFTTLTLNGGQVEGVIFDGNRDNFPFARWEATAELLSKSGTTDNKAFNLNFQNVPGEAFIAQGSALTAANLTFNTIGGNGIHLSGMTGAELSDLTGTDGNKDIAVGHQSGLICSSNSNTDINALNITVRAYIGVVGEMNDTDGNFAITHVHGYDLYCYGAEGGGEVSGITLRDWEIDGVATDTSKRPELNSFGGVVLVGLDGENYTLDNITVKNVTAGALNHGVLISSKGTAGKSARDVKINARNIEGEVVLSGNTTGDGIVNFELIGKITGNLKLDGRLTTGQIHPTIDATGLVVYTSRFMAGGVYTKIDYELATHIGGYRAIDFDPDADYINMNYSFNKHDNQTNQGPLLGAFTAKGKFTFKGNEVTVGPDTLDDFCCYDLRANGVDYRDNEAANFEADEDGDPRLTGVTAFLMAGGIAVVGPVTDALNTSFLRGSVVRGNANGTPTFSESISIAPDAGLRVTDSTIEGPDISAGSGNTVEAAELV